MSEARVVSLLPAATEMIAALGAWDRLVGVTHECDHPAAALHLPKVTSSIVDPGASAAAVDLAVRDAVASGAALFTLDEARLRALQPSILITQGLCDVCAVAEGDVFRLAASLPVPATVVSLGARTLDEVLDSLLTLAHALDADDEGAELVAGLRARMRRVHETLKAARAPRPRVAVIEWTDPLYVAGHWVPDMVRRAGGIDVAATAGEHSHPRPVAQLRDADPEVLVFAPCGYGLARACDEARLTLARDEWRWARDRRVVVMDGNAFTSRPGPRLIDGIEIMARLFNPKLFSPLLPDRGAAISPG
ncbi:MAG: ABC transporter substrate-binding protein [Gemmatimonadetes bacterium]|nr:ABC transporter substrate-binding protein [Gemmatimonadota bacterium]